MAIVSFFLSLSIKLFKMFYFYTIQNLNYLLLFLLCKFTTYFSFFFNIFNRVKNTFTINFFFIFIFFIFNLKNLHNFIFLIVFIYTRVLGFRVYFPVYRVFFKSIFKFSFIGNCEFLIVISKLFLCNKNEEIDSSCLNSNEVDYTDWGNLEEDNESEYEKYAWTFSLPLLNHLYLKFKLLDKEFFLKLDLGDITKTFTDNSFSFITLNHYFYFFKCYEFLLNKYNFTHCDFYLTYIFKFYVDALIFTSYEKKEEIIFKECKYNKEFYYKLKVISILERSVITFIYFNSPFYINDPLTPQELIDKKENLEIMHNFLFGKEGILNVKNHQMYLKVIKKISNSGYQSLNQQELGLLKKYISTKRVLSKSLPFSRFDLVFKPIDSGKVIYSRKYKAKVVYKRVGKKN